MIGLRLAGAAILVVSGCAAGVGCVSAVNTQLRLMDDLSSALGIIKNEICCLQAPLPDVFLSLHEHGPVLTREFFGFLKTESELSGVRAAWEKGVHCLDIGVEAKLCLERLGLSLGRYDADRQSQEIDAVRLTLSGFADELRRERDRRVRMYPGLGASAGALVAVMLL